MDRSAIGELVDYTEWAFERTARCIDALHPEQYLAAPPGLQWSPAECVEHLFGGYDMWLNALFGPGPELLPDGSGTPDWPTATRLRPQLMARIRAALRSDDEALYGPRILMRGDEELPPRSLADVIVDLLLHERGHYGDFTTFFSALGVKPYFNDYIIFKTEPHAWYQDD